MHRAEYVAHIPAERLQSNLIINSPRTYMKYIPEEEETPSMLQKCN